MKDPILELIVKFSETSPALETALTLVAGGTLISGRVISKTKYMEANPLTSQIQAAIDNVAKDLPDTESKDDGERRFIHLENAKYFVPGQPPIPTSGYVLCRLRLESIDGFHLGQLSVDALSLEVGDSERDPPAEE
jgi:hypothetical protein